MQRMLQSKKGAFIDFPRALTLPNVVIIILLGMFLLYFGNYLLNLWFDIDMIALQVPFQILLYVLAVGAAFMVVVRKQGSLDRGDFLSIILVSGGFALLAFYLPVLIPELSKQAIFSNPSSPVKYISDVAQSILPTP